MAAVSSKPLGARGLARSIRVRRRVDFSTWTTARRRGSEQIPRRRPLDTAANPGDLLPVEWRCQAGAHVRIRATLWGHHTAGSLGRNWASVLCNRSGTGNDDCLRSLRRARRFSRPNLIRDHRIHIDRIVAGNDGVVGTTDRSGITRCVESQRVVVSLDRGGENSGGGV